MKTKSKKSEAWRKDQDRRAKQRREYWDERERLEKLETQVAELTSELQNSNGKIGVIARDAMRDLTRARLALRLILHALAEQRSPSATLRIVKRHAKNALECEI